MLGRKIQKAKAISGARLKSLHEHAGHAAHEAAQPILARVVREKHNRVRVLITNEENEILLVRSWFSHQRWSLPGGGIKATETPTEAAGREVFEETGIRVPIDELRELGSFTNTASKAQFTITCFAIEVAKRPATIAKRRRLEMLDVAWFPLDHLPRQLSPTVTEALKLA